jgi:hypothetical protein
MKTEKELLQIILTQGNISFKKGNKNSDLYYEGYMGLCGFITDLCRLNVIDSVEADILENFINNNRPEPNSPHYNISQGSSPYYWRNGSWRPRKKWLKDMIKSLI